MEAHERGEGTFLLPDAHGGGVSRAPFGGYAVAEFHKEEHLEELKVDMQVSIVCFEHARKSRELSRS